MSNTVHIKSEPHYALISCLERTVKLKRRLCVTYQKGRKMTSVERCNALTSSSKTPFFLFPLSIVNTFAPHRNTIFFSSERKKVRRRGGGDFLVFPFDLTPPVAQQAAICRRFTVALTPCMVSYSAAEGRMTNKAEAYGVCYATFSDGGSVK